MTSRIEMDGSLSPAMPLVSIASSVGSDAVASEETCSVKVAGVGNKTRMTIEWASVEDITGMTSINDDMAMTGMGRN